MTKNCIKIVHKLEEDSEAFESLSAEQLLYAAIKGTSVEDVKHVLDNTDWSEWINNASR